MKIKQILDRIKEEDRTTYEHSIRCGNYLAVFAEEQGMGRIDVQNYREAGYLHDVGKLQVMKYVKSNVNIRELSEEARKDYKTALTMHVKYSHPILLSISDCKQEYLDAADYHHAHNSDPKAGYSIETVRGQSDVTPIKSAIPKVAKMLAIIDVYDALTDPNRAYRNGALSEEKVHKIMQENLNNGQFDPHLFKDFYEKVLPRIKNMTSEEKLNIKLPSDQKKMLMNMFKEPKQDIYSLKSELSSDDNMPKLDKNMNM
ncbi:MAG: HD domain-containing protein [Lachnospiraceae bacterium]|nr:HD domain-containing protein [Lachnospiraceae bacterium]